MNHTPNGFQLILGQRIERERQQKHLSKPADRFAVAVGRLQRIQFIAKQNLIRREDAGPTALFGLGTLDVREQDSVTAGKDQLALILSFIVPEQRLLLEQIHEGIHIFADLADGIDLRLDVG